MMSCPFHAAKQAYIDRQNGDVSCGEEEGFIDGWEAAEKYYQQRIADLEAERDVLKRENAKLAKLCRDYIEQNVDLATDMVSLKTRCATLRWRLAIREQDCDRYLPQTPREKYLHETWGELRRDNYLEVIEELRTLRHEVKQYLMGWGIYIRGHIAGVSLALNHLADLVFDDGIQAWDHMKKEGYTDPAEELRTLQQAVRERIKPIVEAVARDNQEAASQCMVDMVNKLAALVKEGK